MSDDISYLASPPTLPDYGLEVEQEVLTILSVLAEKSEKYGSDFLNLATFASQCILGGKMLRPKLLMGAYDILSRLNNRRSALEIAAAVELLHFSFLLHDDVIDGDLSRRGRLNLIGTVLEHRTPGSSASPDPDQLHWAHANGILMGDLLLSLAHQIVARQDLDQDMRIRLLDLLDHTITESVAGEYLDVGLSKGVVNSSLETVLEMSRLKTATYSFELPLRAAAILAGLSVEQETRIGLVGEELGIAFQLQDDFLSTFGSAEEHGKDAFSDLREGKETVIISYARTTDAWPSIEEDFARPDLSDESGSAIRDQLIGCGAQAFTQSLIDDLLAQCHKLIDELETTSAYGLSALFGSLMGSLEGRRS